MDAVPSTSRQGTPPDAVPSTSHATTAPPPPDGVPSPPHQVAPPCSCRLTAVELEAGGRVRFLCFARDERKHVGGRSLPYFRCLVCRIKIEDSDLEEHPFRCPGAERHCCASCVVKPDWDAARRTSLPTPEFQRPADVTEVVKDERGAARAMRTKVEDDDDDGSPAPPVGRARTRVAVTSPRDVKQENAEEEGEASGACVTQIQTRGATPTPVPPADAEDEDDDDGDDVAPRAAPAPCIDLAAHAVKLESLAETSTRAQSRESEDDATSPAHFRGRATHTQSRVCEQTARGNHEHQGAEPEAGPSGRDVPTSPAHDRGQHSGGVSRVAAAENTAPSGGHESSDGDAMEDDDDAPFRDETGSDPEGDVMDDDATPSRDRDEARSDPQDDADDAMDDVDLAAADNAASAVAEAESGPDDAAGDAMNDDIVPSGGEADSDADVAAPSGGDARSDPEDDASEREEDVSDSDPDWRLSDDQSGGETSSIIAHTSRVTRSGHRPRVSREDGAPGTSGETGTTPNSNIAHQPRASGVDEDSDSDSGE